MGFSAKYTYKKYFYTSEKVYTGGVQGSLERTHHSIV
jgi:hypothetical protein